MNQSLFDALSIWVPQNYDLVIHIFLIVFLSLMINFVVVRFLRRLTRRLEKTPSLWDNTLTDSLSRPAGYFIWVVGLSVAINTIDAFEESKSFLSTFNVFKDVVLVGLIGWFLVRFTKRVEDIYAAEERYDTTTVHAISKLFRISVFVTVGLLVLNNLGYSIKGVLALGGVGGIALGFAAKDLLANFFGGLVIYFDRPFSVGDWIKSPDKEIEGYVEHIGWRSTKIRTFEKRPLYVPNSSFNQISIQNPSRMTNRRIREIIGVRYEDLPAIKAIVDDIRTMLKAHKGIDTNMILIVNFSTFAASSLDIFIYTFTRTIQWVEYHEVKQDVLLQIAAIINRHGAEIAFPSSTLYLHQGKDTEALIPREEGQMPSR